MPIKPEDLPVNDPELAAEQLVKSMGIELTEVSQDRVVGTMPVTGNRQPFGLLHGGANAVLIETLGSIGAAMYAMPERFPVGLELSCTHHGSAREGLVTGVATPIHVGRSTSTFDVVITDEQDRVTCTGRLTCMHLDRHPGRPARAAASNGARVPNG
ncbi:MAG TPA: hotdog fold thioesterase [Pseudonocardia sp.]|nr:hotdog fold thioesterase [Pseudonocardia sp.]